MGNAVSVVIVIPVIATQIAFCDRPTGVGGLLRGPGST